MSIDGANIGVSPSRALRTIIGGESTPPLDDQRSDSEFSEYIATAPEPPFDSEDQGQNYDNCCRYIAKHFVSLLIEDPDSSLNHAYDEAKRRGMKSVDPTGFMVGWAYNAARKILNLKEAPNPAIVDIEVG